ncbi:MAG: hypothetical protein AB1445_12690 [Bacillota bacterium]
MVAEENGTITACALTTAELPGVAMLGGLYATSASRQALTPVIAGLIQSLAEDGKVACVVTRDHPIDEICDGLGFEDLGAWLTVHLASSEPS